MSLWGNTAPAPLTPENPPSPAFWQRPLGVRRDEEQQQLALSQHYSAAVCVLNTGEILRDYHTTQAPKGKRTYATRREEMMSGMAEIKTILSQRDYRTDALYHVAIWPNTDPAPHSLNTLKEKLLAPHFVLYLGRKSCPVSLPLFPLVIQGDTLKQAFAAYPRDKAAPWLERIEKPANPTPCYFEPGSLSEHRLGMEPTMRYPRRDQIISRKRWQFANRDECRHDPSINTEDTTDA